MLQEKTTGRLLRRFSNEKPTLNVVGTNQVGKWTVRMAEWLGKPDPKRFTSHCMRRTAATLLAESGASLPLMKIAGGWASASVAEGYISTSKRTLQVVADGLGIGDRKVGDSIIISSQMIESPPVKKQKPCGDENMGGNNLNNIAQQFTFGSVSNCTFYFGVPAPEAAPTKPIPPVVESVQLPSPHAAHEKEEVALKMLKTKAMKVTSRSKEANRTNLNVQSAPMNLRNRRL